jgi:hypothetical protein
MCHGKWSNGSQIEIWGGHREHSYLASILFYSLRRTAGQESTTQKHKFLGITQQ